MSKKKKKKHFHHAPVTPPVTVNAPVNPPQPAAAPEVTTEPAITSPDPVTVAPTIDTTPQGSEVASTEAPTPHDHVSVAGEGISVAADEPAPVVSTTSDAPTTSALPAAITPLPLPPARRRWLAVRPWQAFVAGVVTAIAGWYAYTLLPTPQPTAEGGYPAVVARVNGEEITANDLVNGITQTETVAVSQGLDIASEEARAAIEEEALTILTNTRLLVQAARAASYEASETEVADQISILSEQFGSREALLGQAASLGLSEADLRQDIEEQLIVDKYLRETVNTDEVTVTPEEIATVYQGLVDSGQELPPLESVGSAIEAQLIGQKQQDLIADHLETLRASANIEILI